MYTHSHFKRTLLASLIAASISGLAGCGGGGSDSSNTTSNDNQNGSINSPGISVITAKQGQLFDNQLGGIFYESGQVSGITDENGVFEYEEGESVTFSIVDEDGNAEEIGRIDSGKDVVMLDELTSDQAELTAMLVLLQSLDNDGNPDNGIFIDKLTPQQLRHLQSTGIGSTAEVQSWLAQYIDDEDIVTEQEALDHYENTIYRVQRMLNGTYKGSGTVVAGQCTLTEGWEAEVKIVAELIDGIIAPENPKPADISFQISNPNNNVFSTFDGTFHSDSPFNFTISNNTGIEATGSIGEESLQSGEMAIEFSDDTGASCTLSFALVQSSDNNAPFANLEAYFEQSYFGGQRKEVFNLTDEANTQFPWATRNVCYDEQLSLDPLSEANGIAEGEINEETIHEWLIENGHYVDFYNWLKGDFHFADIEPEAVEIEETRSATAIPNSEKTLWEAFNEWVLEKNIDIDSLTQIAEESARIKYVNQLVNDTDGFLRDQTWTFSQGASSETFPTFNGMVQAVNNAAPAYNRHEEFTISVAVTDNQGKQATHSHTYPGKQPYRGDCASLTSDISQATGNWSARLHDIEFTTPQGYQCTDCEFYIEVESSGDYTAYVADTTYNHDTREIESVCEALPPGSLHNNEFTQLAVTNSDLYNINSSELFIEEELTGDQNAGFVFYKFREAYHAPHECRENISGNIGDNNENEWPEREEAFEEAQTETEWEF